MARPFIELIHSQDHGSQAQAKVAFLGFTGNYLYFSAEYVTCWMLAFPPPRTSTSSTCSCDTRLICTCTNVI